jgi:hypothetical protein
MQKRSDPNSGLIAENRQARYHYAIEQDLEAGVILTGSEVKSLRTGQTNITEAYVAVEGGRALAGERPYRGPERRGRVRSRGAAPAQAPGLTP